MKRDYKGSDRFNVLAREKKLPSRAYFKLKEIMDRFLKKRYEVVIDLGCAPGGWSAELVKRSSKVIGVDITEVNLRHPSFIFIKGDVKDDETLRKIGEVARKVDAVFSDLAPSVSGIADVDQERFYELFKCAVKVFKNFLKEGGDAVIKTFQGSRWDEIYRAFKGLFEEVKVFKPQASRRSVKEIYLIGRGYKGGEV